MEMYEGSQLIGYATGDRIPHGKGTVHAKISGYYSSIPISGFTNGLTVRQWLSGQSFQLQFDFGLNLLKNMVK